jgi:hypothetical protein
MGFRGTPCGLTPRNARCNNHGGLSRFRVFTRRSVNIRQGKWGYPATVRRGGGRVVMRLRSGSGLATTVTGRTACQAVVMYAEARGTDAVKLSAKWLTALAAIALLVVAVAGSVKSTKAAVGTIHATNMWSKLTTESPAPTGEIFVGAGKSLYATYVPLSPVTRLIQLNSPGVGDSSNRLKLTVLDTGRNLTTTVWDDAGFSQGAFDGSGYSFLTATTVGNTQIFTLSEISKPIAGVITDIVLVDRSQTRALGADGLPGGTLTNADTFTAISNSSLAVNNFFAGDGLTVPGWIQVIRNGGAGIVVFDIRYQTSLQEYISATVKTDVANVTGANVNLIETTRSSARFVGFVNILNSTQTVLNSNPLTGITAPSSVANEAAVPANAGPVTITYTDSDNVVRSLTVLIDTLPPTLNITSPGHNSATQNRFPAFSFNANDVGAGLKLVQQTAASVNVGPGNSLFLAIDRGNDGANGTPTLNATTGALAGTAPEFAQLESLSLGTVVDGQATLTVNHTSLTALPNGTIVTPNHQVGIQAGAIDLAGNLGFSDSSATATGGVLGAAMPSGFNELVVRIDQTIPQFVTNTPGCNPNTPVLSGTACENATGKTFDAAVPGDSTSVTSRSAVKVSFDGPVTGVDATDFSVTVSTGGTHVPTSVTVNNTTTTPFHGVVYLTLATSLPPGSTVTVALVGLVSDTANNATQTGSVATADGIPPAITIVRSAGSGTGTAGTAEDSTSLTKASMTFTVTVDENVGTPPTIRIQRAGPVDESGNPGTAMSALGNNVFTYIHSAVGGVSGSRFVEVTAADVAGNSGKGGSLTTAAYTVDVVLATPTVAPANNGTTTFAKPIILIDYGVAGEASSVVITEMTLDGTNVTAQLVRATNSKLFYLVPTTNLANGSHTLVIPALKATDAAGNQNGTATTIVFTKRDRVTFDLAMASGWNSKSFPANPVNPDINAVFTNTSIDIVVAYDAKAKSFQIATRDPVSGAFTSTGANPLTTIVSGRGYMVHTGNFEPVKVMLVGPSEPTVGQPPAIASIDVEAGWNFVGASDSTLVQSEGASGTQLNRNGGPAVALSNYLAGVTWNRAYQFNTTGLAWVELLGGSAVNTGMGIWVFIVPNADGTVADILP